MANFWDLIYDYKLPHGKIFLQFWHLHKNLLETLAIDAFARKNSQAQLSDQLMLAAATASNKNGREKR